MNGVGVVRVIVITARADVKIRSDVDAERKLIRWRGITLEASKQCGRARLMTLKSTAFDEFVSGQQTENCV